MNIQKYREIKEKENKAAIRSIENYHTFFKNFWHIISAEELSDNWHIEYLCNQFQKIGVKVLKGEPVLDTFINVPPGSTKTSIATVAFPAWLWLHMPSAKIFKISYSGTISTDSNIKTKMIIQSERYQKWFQPYINKRYNDDLKIIKNHEKDFRNNYGGVQFASSTGGTMTGLHAHILIWDDPNSQEQSESAVYRERANRFGDRTLTNRKIDKGKNPIITIMQRLHKNDATGHNLNKGENINHICIPAELSNNVKPEKLKKYYKDGIMDVNRMSKEVLDKQKKKMGSYGYAGQYQQRPSPEGGGMVKYDWFGFLWPGDIPANLVTDIWIDGAYTKSTKNDPTGIMICQFDRKNNTLFVFRFEDKRLEMPSLIKHIEAISENCSDRTKIFIEPKASGKSLKQMLQQKNLNPVEIKSSLVSEGKEARLNTASPRIEAGKVMLVYGNWNDEFTAQITNFPNYDHDEAVDLIGYACDYYFGRKKKRAPKRTN